MDIPTGRLVDHPLAIVLPLDASQSPGVAPPTMIQPGALTGPTYDGRDTQGEYAETMAAALAECQSAMSSGMSDENSRRDHYNRDIQPLSADYGDLMDLPRVPEDASGSATPPAGGYLFGTGGGDQPGRGDAP
jgi:hypothetical protein